MRTLLLATSLTLLSATACTDSPDPLPPPPVLRVTSPQRSLIRDGAGPLVVTGTVAPNQDGVPVRTVKVNGVPAVVGADGAFQAMIDLPAGATLIHTEAVDDRGGKATDTRSALAGQLRQPGANVENALATAVSKQAFGKLASAAGAMIEQTDFAPVLAPMNPVMHSGDESGPDCLYARLAVNDLDLSHATITLVPVNGGLSFSAKLDGMDIPGRATYAVACLDGSNTVRVQAQSVLIQGTLLVRPDADGFTTELANETVQVTGMSITASGLPGTVLDMLPLGTVVEYLAPLAANLFMESMINDALGGLAGPQQVEVAGKKVTIEVSPSDVTFDAAGALVTLDARAAIEGAASSKGFIFTDNGYPSMDPGQGMAIGLADDLANSMLSQLVATRLLDIQMEAHGGSFDGTDLTPTSPPMISADPASGQMRLVVPDMMATYTLHGQPVGKAAINVSIELKITPAINGYGVAIELGAPTIYANVLDDVPNQTMMSDADLGKATELALVSQLNAIKALLGAIPLPSLPVGVTMRNVSVGADDGYVLIKGSLE